MSSAYITLVTGNTTVDSGWDTYLIDATGGNITMTMITPVGEGGLFTFSRIDATANTVSIVGGASENINGAATFSLLSHENVTFVSFNDQWYTVAGKWD